MTLALHGRAHDKMPPLQMQVTTLSSKEDPLTVAAEAGFVEEKVEGFRLSPAEYFFREANGARLSRKGFGDRVVGTAQVEPLALASAFAKESEAGDRQLLALRQQGEAQGHQKEGQRGGASGGHDCMRSGPVCGAKASQSAFYVDQLCARVRTHRSGRGWTHAQVQAHMWATAFVASSRRRTDRHSAEKWASGQLASLAAHG